MAIPVSEKPSPEAHDFLPPGTVHLLRVHDELNSDELVLVPKPSSHPDDPLNWSKWRKLLHVFNVYLYTFTVGVGATCTYSYLVDISDDTGITLTQLNLGTGFIFLLAGWGNLFWQPLALSFGRRPVYLLSLLTLAAVTEGTAWVDNFPQWAAVRILYGFLVAPVESLPEVSIPDTYFAHERGSYIGVYSFVLSGSNFVAPLIAGFMNQSVGWRWVQHWAALLLLANFILSFFTLEESMYFRNTVEADNSTETPPPGRVQAAVNPDSDTSDEKLEPVTNTRGSNHVGESTMMPPRKTYRQKLALFTTSKFGFQDTFKFAWRPMLILVQFPTIAWAGVQYGFTNAWYVHTPPELRKAVLTILQVLRLQRDCVVNLVCCTI
jgi:MFS family permease